MGKVIKITRGLDISIVGEASTEIISAGSSRAFAIKPTDFKGLIPKLEVKEGDEVKAGDCLFINKNNPAVCFTSPVSGEIAEIVRGDRRAIQEIRILADATTNYKNFATENYTAKTRDELKSLMLEAGLWTFLIQRPFGIIAETDVVPKAIHVSGFDSAPLAADLGITLKGEEANLKVGFDILRKLTDGKVHLNLHKKKATDIYNLVEGVEKTTFSGPHPSGLVGVQINKIDPINKGDVVWTIKPQHVAFIGKFFLTGKLDLTQKIVVAGSEVKKPAYYTSCVGSNLSAILENNTSSNVRIISGNVLTGKKVSEDGYLGHYDNQITVIPEGNEYELLGWLLPSYPRPTISSTFPLSKFFKKKFKVNTNPHGEPRAFVVTGEYEKVMPMDIMPQQLLKAVMAQDLERMENLGIYEVIEEDMALCEFVCTSKIDVQRVLSEGLELMAEES